MASETITYDKADLRATLLARSKLWTMKPRLKLKEIRIALVDYLQRKDYFGR
jgi:hypothetical protein